MTIGQKFSTAGFIIVALLIFGGLAYWGYTVYLEKNKAFWEETERINKQKAAETLVIVKDVAAQLSEDTDGSSKFKHHENPLRQEDAWGVKLQVSYNKPWFRNERLTVVSAGADGSFGTKDDISVERVR